MEITHNHNNSKFTFIDTKHDYMKLIYDFVIDTNKPKKDIYQIIHADFEDFLKSPDFIQEKQTGNEDFIVDEIYPWVMNYANNMTDDAKNELYSKYGMKKLFSKLHDIAWLNSFYNFDDFIQENPDDYEDHIISYIIENEIIFDLIKEHCPSYPFGNDE